MRNAFTRQSLAFYLAFKERNKALIALLQVSQNFAPR
ncbi:hypothetical protein EMIT0P228_60245 [Pseudomonas brassicacearum]